MTREKRTNHPRHHFRDWEAGEVTDPWPTRPARYPWDLWHREAIAARVSKKLADLGRAVIRNSYLHRWFDHNAALHTECGWEDDGAAMIALAKDSPVRARQRWTALLETDGGLHHRAVRTRMSQRVRESLEDWDYVAVKKGIEVLQGLHGALSEHGGLRVQLIELQDLLEDLIEKDEVDPHADVFELADNLAEELDGYADRIKDLAVVLGELVNHHPENLEEDGNEEE